MSSRPARAKRVRKSAAARVRPFWILILVGAEFVAGAVALVVFWPGFAPHAITVTGNRRVSTAEILDRAAIPAHRSIWLDNTKAIAARIRTIPYIGTVRIGRLPPASVRIAVSERTPYAVLQSAGSAALVDRDLRVLAWDDGESELPTLVVSENLVLDPGSFVTARDAMALRDAEALLSSAGLSPASLSAGRYGELVATMPGGLRVLLGTPNDLAQKVRLVNAIRAQVVQGRRGVSAIDVRAPAAPVVVYR